MKLSNSSENDAVQWRVRRQLSKTCSVSCLTEVIQRCKSFKFEIQHQKMFD